MLAGAQLTAPARPIDHRYAGSMRQVRLQIARSRTQWPTLAWAIIVLESNGLPMTLRTVDPDGGKISYRSKPTNLLLRERRRWYFDRASASVPLGLTLSDATLAVWLTGALADDIAATRGCDPDPNRPLRLTAPRMSDSVAAQLAFHIRQRGWRCAIRHPRGAPLQDFALSLEAPDRAQAQQWLDALVPRQAWDTPAPPDDDPADDDARPRDANVTDLT
jgi:hypothetical protein